MKCPTCTRADLVHDTRDIPYTYKEMTAIFPEIEGDFCPVCGEGILSPEAIDHFGELARQFQKQVNADLVDSVSHSCKFPGAVK